MRSWFSKSLAATFVVSALTATTGAGPQDPVGGAQAPAADAGKNAPQNAPANPQQAPQGAQPQAGPDPIPESHLPTLPTVPHRRAAREYNWIVADASPLPKDRDGIWVLEFAYKPVRILEIETKEGRRKVYYLYYRIVNRTGKPRPLVPQFTLVDDAGKRYEDVPLPVAVRKVRAKEDPSIQLLGQVQIIGELPASTKDGVDDAVYGVAIWPEIDHKADAFQIYIRGLSDAYQEAAAPQGGKSFTRYKALRLDFKRPGDERDPHPSEIQLADPPFEWTYYP